ncbi:MAG: LacI family DNA-binding transcriptional regulator [Saprospiraceae bacterium]|nr:LacI family DNA-binding transcriptional regulator [Saprospiraceae bacterium]
MASKKVTIHDIARILKIDSSTVSRALNDSPRVKKKTKDKIIAAANELGYQRNQLASSLRKSKTNTIGVIVPRISRYFFSSAIAGIEETAYKLGYNVIICQSLEKVERERELVDTLLAYRVDGLLISVSMETRNYDHLESLKIRKTPHVFFDRHCDIPNNSNVLIDDFQAGYDATQHLISNGYKSIAHFCGPLEMELYKNRFNGYVAALKDNEIPFNKELVIESRLMTEDGVNCIEEILLLPYKVDAVFSANDIAAIGAIKYLKRKGIKIPEDIAFVGFSNEPMSSIIEPALTTINQSGSEIGKKATQLLISIINNDNEEINNETIIVKSQLIERQSSKHVKQKG